MTPNIRLRAAAVVLLVAAGAARAQDSNRNEVRANLERSRSVVWGKNFTEADWARGLKAIAESVAAEDPIPFLQWFEQTLRENFTKIERSLPGVARRDLENWIVQSLKQKRIITYKGFKIEAGFATYNRWKKVSYDEPRTRQKKVKDPFGIGWTYVPEANTERVEKKIPLPNWHQFYIRYQLVPSGGGATSPMTRYSSGTRSGTTRSRACSSVCRPARCTRCSPGRGGRTTTPARRRRCGSTSSLAARRTPCGTATTSSGGSPGRTASGST